MMTRSETVGYPIIMMAAAVLMLGAAFWVVRDGSTTSVSVENQVVAAAMLLAGFAVAAAIDQLWHRRRLRANTTPVAPEHFDPTTIHEIVHVNIDYQRDSASTPPWELTSKELVAQDHVLALAKLRLDLQGELRSLAFHRRVKMGNKDTVAAVTAALIGASVLPARFEEPIHQVIAVCNRAVHGERISTELAEVVVSAGTELLDELRSQSFVMER